MDVSIVVPTFREALNIRPLVERTLQTLNRHALSVEIIIVDDDSRDGTEELCRQLPVRLIVRERERGLATAVLAGMESATGSVLVVMDADLSHPPETIPELVRAIETGADFAIGSRYVDGGSIDDSWNLFRRINSLVATLLARPLMPARDPMAGFFALRRDTCLAASELNPIGYKIGLELYVRCECRSLREIPISFQDRTSGESKLDMRQQWHYLLHLSRLYKTRFPEAVRFGSFGAVGLSGLLVDMGVLFTTAAFVPIQIARSAAILVAMTWNFELNRAITFREANHGRRFADYIRFCGACSLGAVVNWSTSMVLASSVFSDRVMTAGFCGACCGALFNYVSCSRWVFRRDRSAGQSGTSTEAARIPEPARRRNAA